MKSGKALFFICVAAGVASWILDAFFERFVFFGSDRTFLNHLVNISGEEFYDRIITFLVFVALGIVISGLYEKRHAAEEELKVVAAELARSNRELETFAAVASHDLREPLVTVGGFLALLQRRSRGSLDDESNRYIRRALESVTRMELLIGDLLDYCRVDTRTRPFQAVDSSAALDAALKNLAGSLASTGGVVTRDALPEITADPTQIVQLFQNLLGNAVKFCRNGAPRIHVSAVTKGAEHLFSVRDNGIGIAPEHTGEIFLAFRRLNGESEFPGTGLGLATCARIVDRHCGRIWVESKPGEGSTFYFTVPARGPEPVRR